MIEPFKPIETERLRLRWVEPTDAPAGSRLMTPEVARWLASWPAPLSMKMAEERIARARARVQEKAALHLAIVRKDDSVFMGWIGAAALDPGRATFAYWLGKEFHGAGYMREAAPAALAAAFGFLNVSAVEAGAQLANAASFAVMKACGMRPIGERLTFAPSRQVEEMCAYYEATAP